ncbi:Purine ribonucleoside efflux pump nepI [Serratia entomophila]|uniref:MFS transporter n=1 Tax=Serratia entomophila TaxID=42906 RepID=UPI002177BEA3|nr:MFS transporter [Serratia entomophila]CAI1740855.1 Purine ribonucleoside efflux pump nepI [Serratia entomophila]CAI2925666.1 Purine ribonucleoside efflux pump nepI [Serratia entomophila]
MNHTRAAAAPAGGVKPWLAVASIGLSTFSVVTAEILPIGLLNPIADNFHATLGRAGLMLTLPALFAAAFAPLVVLIFNSMNRRALLAGFLLLLIATNLLSAVATSLNALLAARVMLGFCIGGIWVIAGSIAGRLVPPTSVALALSIIFGGVAAASVFGVPIGVFIGTALGWRAAFLAVAGLVALTLILQLATLPSLPVESPARIRQFAEQLANRRLLAGLLLTFLLVAGHFMAYTFVRPMLQSLSGVDGRWIGPLLFAYGLAGIVGNFIAGHAAAKHLRATLALIAIGLAAAVTFFALAGGTPLSGSAAILLWGIAYGGVSVSLMAWMLKAAPNAVEVASAFYIALFNLAICCGSLAGGQLVDHSGLIACAAGAGICMALALTLLAGARAPA